MAYIPIYDWHRTQIDENHEPTDFDWLGEDRDYYIGRVRKEFGGPKDGKWQWAGQGPVHIRQRILPHLGYCDTARQAVEKVEDYYHRLMRHNGLRGSRDTAE